MRLLQGGRGALWRWPPNTGNKYNVCMREKPGFENWPLNRGWPLNTGSTVERGRENHIIFILV